MEHLANHDAHGYSQENRYGTGWFEKVDVGDGKEVTLHDEYDCSMSVIDSYKVQGIATGGASFTGDMYRLLDSGYFISVPVENMQRGDILNTTKNRHAVMYLGNGKIAEALHGDSADGLGGQVGDQDGTEIWIRDYYDDNWTACYRCTAKEDGWHKEQGDWYYYQDYKPLLSQWIKDPSNQQWYYVNYLGIMLKNRWIKDCDIWYYLKDNGTMARNEPVKWNGGWCWADAVGKVKETGTLQIVDWHIK